MQPCTLCTPGDFPLMTPRHNTIFQGLAADGAKLALWQLWRAGYRIVNFIHDEVLIELPADVNLAHHAEIVHRLMVSAMREVVPDVRVDVQYSLSDRWAKDAEVYFDEAGRLGVWRGEVKQWKSGSLNVAEGAYIGRVDLVPTPSQLNVHFVKTLGRLVARETCRGWRHLLRHGL